jgi:hypothetical protein
MGRVISFVGNVEEAGGGDGRREAALVGTLGSRVSFMFSPCRIFLFLICFWLSFGEGFGGYGLWTGRGVEEGGIHEDSNVQNTQPG